MDDGRRHTEPLKALHVLAGRFDGLAGGLGAVQRAWPQVVGPQMARATMPVKLEGAELRVRCSSSTWASELLAVSGVVVGKLRAALGDQAPTRLRPYAGRLPAMEAPPAPPRREPPIVLDALSLEDARRDVAGITGPLAESMARALAASRARRPG